MITMTDLLSFWLHHHEDPIKCCMLDGRIGYLASVPRDKSAAPDRIGFKVSGEPKTRWVKLTDLELRMYAGSTLLFEI